VVQIADDGQDPRRTEAMPGVMGEESGGLSGGPDAFAAGRPAVVLAGSSGGAARRPADSREGRGLGRLDDLCQRSC
jgi:hypothetical protein